METLEQRIQRVAQEDVAITPYDPRWPELFRQEKGHLLNCLPNELIRRIEHFGWKLLLQDCALNAGIRCQLPFVSLRQNGVGASKNNADAILPKGHLLLMPLTQLHVRAKTTEIIFVHSLYFAHKSAIFIA
jgi:hypothetical protein